MCIFHQSNLACQFNTIVTENMPIDLSFLIHTILSHTSYLYSHSDKINFHLLITIKPLEGNHSLTYWWSTKEYTFRDH